MSSESILLNPLRRKIYSLVAQSPGSNFSKITNALEIASSTLNWHLKRLENSGLLKSTKIGNKRIYYPASLRTELAEEIIQVLSNETARNIFLYVINIPDEECYALNIARNLNPAIHHETVRYHLERMKKVNLIKEVKIGKTVYARPGSEAFRLKEHGMNVITDAYIEFLLKEFNDNCLYPEILIEESDRLVLRIDCLNGEEIIMDLMLSDWNFQKITDEIHNYNSA